MIVTLTEEADIHLGRRSWCVHVSSMSFQHVNVSEILSNVYPITTNVVPFPQGIVYVVAEDFHTTHMLFSPSPYLLSVSSRLLALDIVNTVARLPRNHQNHADVRPKFTTTPYLIHSRRSPISPLHLVSNLISNQSIHPIIPIQLYIKRSLDRSHNPRSNISFNKWHQYGECIARRLRKSQYPLTLSLLDRKEGRYGMMMCEDRV